MKIIRNFIPPRESTPYNPSKSVSLAAEGTGEIKMNGMGGDVFGIRRILPFAPEMNKIKVSARLNEDLYIFRDVLLSTVHTLFKSIDGLFAPFVIQKNNHIVFELENLATSSQAVNIQIIGYDQFAMSNLRQAYDRLGSAMPTPRFLYGHATVQAGAVNVDLGVRSKSMDVEVRRIAMSADSNEDSIMSSMRVYNNTIRKDVFIRQVNDEFDGAYANVPFIVGSNVPFTIYASNTAASAVQVSFLCESYEAVKEQDLHE